MSRLGKLPRADYVIDRSVLQTTDWVTVALLIAGGFAVFVLTLVVV